MTIDITGRWRLLTIGVRSIAAASGCLALLLAASFPISARAAAPSRAPVPGCVWEQSSDAGIGLAAWVQRCDFGGRKIDLFFKQQSLFIRYSDGGAPEPLIDVLPLRGNETAGQALLRIFAARTDRAVAKRCVLALYRESTLPAGVIRYTFVPDAAYQKELDAQADSSDIPEPPCGEWGAMPDGIQYFEVHPGSKVRKLLFVRVGQDEPLFDENTLQLIE